MPGMINLQPQDMQGILDRLKNGRELLKFLSSGLVSEVLDIINLVPDGKYGEAVVDVGDILVIAGLTEEGEAVRALGSAMTPRPFDWVKIIPPAVKVEELLLLRLAVALQHPAMGERVDIKDASREVMQKWLADNTAGLREGRDRAGIHRILERWCPEVLAAMEGQPQEMALTPEQAEKLIKSIGVAIVIITALGVFWPPAAPFCVLINVGLRAAQIYLKSRFPEISALPDFTPDGTERGLALDDFVVLA